MTTQIKGSELRVGDVIDVWWQPNKDTITGLRPYKGRLESIFPEGAQLAEFLINKSGMTIDNSDYYDLIVRRMS